MNKLERSLLIRKLKKNGIEIDNNDLDDVINAFNNIIDFYLDADKNLVYYRYGFIMTPKVFYEVDDTNFNSIFNLLISMKKNNLLHYLDYAFILHNYDWDYDRLHELYRFLHNIMRKYNDSEIKEDFIYEFIDENDYLLQDVIDNNFDEIMESKYVNQEYKDIMNLYNNIIKWYYDTDYLDYDDDAFFDEFINMSYYYFLINNLFNTEPERIIYFLNKIKEDIPSLCDKLNMDGEMELKDRINYIDSLYKSKDKVKIIK